MTEINLLPWREIAREHNKKQFSVMLLIALITSVVIVAIMNFYVTSLIESQSTRNERLKQEIVLFDQQIIEIKKLKELRSNLISRMMIVQGLQSRRMLTVHLFDEIIKVLPDNVYLTNVKRVADEVTMMGYSDSNSNVSLLMRNIQNNPWIQEPELTEIKKPTDEAIKTQNEFSLSFTLKPNVKTMQ